MANNVSLPSTGATLSRRSFLKNAGMTLAAGALFPTLIPSRALGRDGNVAPSNRITMGLVGTNQGWSDMRDFFRIKEVQPVAICDVDSSRTNARASEVDRRYGKGTGRFTDFREMFAKTKLDTVIIAPPDHWHAIIAIAAARKGIHIYGEKPLAHTLVEGRAIANVVKQRGIVWQTGSWQRSTGNFYRAVELVRGGAIGKISHVEVGTLATQNGFGASLGSKPDPTKIGKPPAHLNYDMWIGPAQWMEYDPRFVTYHWRWILNFGGGNLMDWVGHHVDIAHWALDFDKTGPIKVEGKGRYSTKAPWDAEEYYEYKCTYDNGQIITVGSDFATGTKFFGENGKWIHVDRGRLDASDKDILRTEIEDSQVYRSQNHSQNFIDCVKRNAVEGTITPVEAAHRSASVGHLGHIAIRTGRTINWDPATETIKDDAVATTLLSPVYRSPWAL